MAGPAADAPSAETPQVVIGKPVHFGGGRYKTKVNFIPHRFKPDVTDLCLTRTGCKATLDLVAQHKRAHEPVVFRPAISVSALGLRDKTLELRAPEGLPHFTLLALAEAIVAAFQGLYEDPAVFKEFCEQYTDTDDTEDLLSRIEVSGFFYDPDEPENSAFSLGGSFTMQKRRPWPTREGPPAAPDPTLVRFVTAPEPTPPRTEEPDDDDDYEWPEDDWPYVGLTQEWLDSHLPRVQGLEEVVIPGKAAIDVVFSCVLAEAHTITLLAPEGQAGFTRRALVEAIARQWQRIYAEEEETAIAPAASAGEQAGVAPAGEQMILTNRAATNGKWGIGMHALGDLALYEVRFDPDKQVYELGIDT